MNTQSELTKMWTTKVLDSLGKQEFADVVFLVGPVGQEIFAHKLILCAGSPVFETMFCSRWNSTDKLQAIELPDVEPVPFRLFLRFIYNQCRLTSKEINSIPMENILDLVYIARKYDIVYVVDILLKALKQRLDVDHAISIYQQAQDFGEVDIENAAFEFIVRRLGEILETNQFNLLRQPNLCKILGIDDLDIKEVSLFQASCRWAAAECKRIRLEVTPSNYRKVLGNALNLIRFPTMKSEELAFQVSNCGILTSDEMVQVLTFVSLPPDRRGNIGQMMKYNVNPRKYHQEYDVPFDEVQDMELEAASVSTLIEQAEKSICKTPERKDASLDIPDEIETSPSLLNQNLSQRPASVVPSQRSPKKLTWSMSQPARPVVKNVTVSNSTKSGWIIPAGENAPEKIKQNVKPSSPVALLQDSNNSKNLFVTPDSSSTSSNNDRNKLDVSSKFKFSNLRHNKILVQPTLLQMSKKFPKPTVDFTTRDNYKGGTRISSVSAVKRKNESEISPSGCPAPISHRIDDNQISSSSSVVHEIKVEKNTENINFMDVQNDGSEEAATCWFEETLLPTIADIKEEEAANGNGPDSSQNEHQPVEEPSIFDRVPFGENTLQMLANFDKVPGQDEPRLVFKYKPDKAVRKKSERAKLPGIVCDMCREYYEGQDLSPEEIQKLINKCSKHRALYEARICTPPDYWRTDFPTTQECIQKGYLHIEERDPNVDPKIRNRI